MDMITELVNLEANEHKEFIEEYYHVARLHQGLDGDPPFLAAKPETVTGASRLVSIPVVGGLHHRHVRVAA
jgi:hypothetical protein